MFKKDDFLIIGITGPFGSGCTTAAKFFEKDFEKIRIEYISGKNKVQADIVKWYKSDADEYQHCKQFLQHFERIFTLNYDLLLYWTLMQEDIIPNLRCDDGFRKPEDKDAEYVTWEPENTYSQNIYYLHGALHIFDAGSEIQKYTWIDTGIPLMEQIRDALEKNYFPLFVAEGTSEEKLTRIKHSDYLSKAYRSFIPIKGALFIYGHSLSDNDNHILRLIEIGKISQLYVSIYGNPEDENNIKLIQKANALTTARHPRNPLEVFFYDAESAQVWR